MTKQRDPEQIVHGQHGQLVLMTVCGIDSSGMTADTSHTVTADEAAVTCDACRVRTGRPYETPLEAIRRGVYQRHHP